MKWKYAVIHGQVKPNWSMEQIEKDMVQYKADVEKKGYKLVFWGHPFGVSEGMIAVLDIEGHMDHFPNNLISGPWIEDRTEFVMVH